MMQNGFKELTGFTLTRFKLRLQSVADRHQFVHLRQYAVLFRKGRNRDGQREEIIR